MKRKKKTNSISNEYKYNHDGEIIVSRSMTKQEIVETALKGVGKKRVQGDTTEPLDVPVWSMGALWDLLGAFDNVFVFETHGEPVAVVIQILVSSIVKELRRDTHRKS